MVVVKAHLTQPLKAGSAEKPAPLQGGGLVHSCLKERAASGRSGELASVIRENDKLLRPHFCQEAVPAKITHA